MVERRFFLWKNENRLSFIAQTDRRIRWVWSSIKNWSWNGEKVDIWQTYKINSRQKSYCAAFKCDNKNKKGDLLFRSDTLHRIKINELNFSLKKQSLSFVQLTLQSSSDSPADDQTRICIIWSLPQAHPLWYDWKSNLAIWDNYSGCHSQSGYSGCHFASRSRRCYQKAE